MRAGRWWAIRPSCGGFLAGSQAQTAHEVVRRPARDERSTRRNRSCHGVELPQKFQLVPKIVLLASWVFAPVTVVI
jgi:hypothetical protein